MWLLLLTLVLTFLFYLIYRNYTHWKRYGIPGPKPLLLFGNLFDLCLGVRNLAEIYADIYNQYQEYPCVGLYRFTTPLLLIRDPEMIKHIVVKDFKHFQDNDMNVDQNIDPVFGRNPFVMKGTDWKNKRTQLTHLFTSGKIKGMYPILKRNSERLVTYVEDESMISETIEAREISLRFTLDNVAACAFGIEGKAFDEPYSDFREMADKFLSPDNFKSKASFFISWVAPDITKYIKIKLIAKEVEDRLFETVRASIKHRKENNLVINDFLDGCININTEQGLFTEVDIVAHAASFFLDGYETSSRAMSFLLYELAANPDVQEKLRQEIFKSLETNGNEFTYESIHSIKYLEACLSESLRKYPILANLSKICTEDYTYISTNPDFKSLTVKLKKGDPIVLPVLGIQFNAKYYKEPERFMPERFLENDKINKFAYLAWGEGQRVCLGQRFATTQIKIGIAHIIKNYQISVNSKTIQPLKYDPYYFFLHAVGGLWLDWKKN